MLDFPLLLYSKDFAGSKDRFEGSHVSVGACRFAGTKNDAVAPIDQML